MKKLIVGIDPGVTCGVAALTLEGSTVFISSQRDWTFNSLLKTLTNLGEPVLVSSDVSPAPQLVGKLSKNLNATTFTPLISLGTLEKQHLARNYAEIQAVKLRNAHEIDALAAALKAYNHFKKKFEQIENRAKGIDSKVSIDDVKALVIKGYTISRAIKHLTAKPGETRLPPIITRRVPREKQLRELVEELKKRLILDKKEIRRLQTENRELNKHIKSLKKEAAELQQKIDDVKSEQTLQMRREREYQRLIDEIESLKRRLSRSTAELEECKQRFNPLQRLRQLESTGELILLKPIENFTRDGLEKAFKLYEVKPGDYVLLLDASGGGASTAETLTKKGVKAVIFETRMSHQAREEFGSHEIPTIPAKDIKIEWIEGSPYAYASSLEDALKNLEEREIDELVGKVEDIVEEHRKDVRNIERQS